MVVVSFIGRKALAGFLTWLVISTILIFAHAALRRTSTNLRLLARLRALDGKLSGMLLRERLLRQLPPEGWQTLRLDAQVRWRLHAARGWEFARAWLADALRALSFERQARIEGRKTRQRARQRAQRRPASNPAEMFYGPVYL